MTSENNQSPNPQASGGGHAPGIQGQQVGDGQARSFWAGVIFSGIGLAATFVFVLLSGFRNQGFDVCTSFFYFIFFMAICFTGAGAAFGGYLGFSGQASGEANNVRHSVAYSAGGAVAMLLVTLVTGALIRYWGMSDACSSDQLSQHIPIRASMCAPGRKCPSELGRWSLKDRQLSYFRESTREVFLRAGQPAIFQWSRPKAAIVSDKGSSDDDRICEIEFLEERALPDSGVVEDGLGPSRDTQVRDPMEAPITVMPARSWLSPDVCVANPGNPCDDGCASVLLRNSPEQMQAAVIVYSRLSPTKYRIRIRRDISAVTKASLEGDTLSLWQTSALVTAALASVSSAGSIELLRGGLTSDDPVDREKARVKLAAQFETYRWQVKRHLGTIANSPNDLSAQDEAFASSLLHSLILAIDRENPRLVPRGKWRDLSQKILSLESIGHGTIVSLSKSSSPVVRKQARRLMSRFPIDSFDQEFASLVGQGGPPRLANASCRVTSIDERLAFAAMQFHYNRMTNFALRPGADAAPYATARQLAFAAAGCLQADDLEIEAALPHYADMFYALARKDREAGRLAAREFLRTVETSTGVYSLPNQISTALRVAACREESIAQCAFGGNTSPSVLSAGVRTEYAVCAQGQEKPANVLRASPVTGPASAAAQEILRVQNGRIVKSGKCGQDELVARIQVLGVAYDEMENVPDASNRYWYLVKAANEAPSPSPWKVGWANLSIVTDR